MTADSNGHHTESKQDWAVMDGAIWLTITSPIEGVTYVKTLAVIPVEALRAAWRQRWEKPMDDDVLRIEIAGTGSESLCQRARALIKQGQAPGRRVEWLRNGQPVWRDTASLSEWAAYSVREDDRHSPTFVKYKPYAGPRE